jgi:hypothetical protein
MMEELTRTQVVPSSRYTSKPAVFTSDAVRHLSTTLSPSAHAANWLTTTAVVPGNLVWTEKLSTKEPLAGAVTVTVTDALFAIST